MVDYPLRIAQSIVAAGGVAPYARALGVNRSSVYGWINGAEPSRASKAKINGYVRRSTYVEPATPTTTVIRTLPDKEIVGQSGLTRNEAIILFNKAKAEGKDPVAVISVNASSDGTLEGIGRDNFYAKSKQGVAKAEAIAKKSAKITAEQRYALATSEWDITSISYSVYWVEG